LTAPLVFLTAFQEKKMNLIYSFLLFFITLHLCQGASELYVTVFAGNGSSGYTGENIPAISAEISPEGVWYVFLMFFSSSLVKLIVFLGQILLGPSSLP
jgi:hypothetical protein